MSEVKFRILHNGAVQLRLGNKKIVTVGKLAGGVYRKVITNSGLQTLWQIKGGAWALNNELLSKVLAPNDVEVRIKDGDTIYTAKASFILEHGVTQEFNPIYGVQTALAKSKWDTVEQPTKQEEPKVEEEPQPQQATLL
jgi:hypothetical protein